MRFDDPEFEPSFLDRVMNSVGTYPEVGPTMPVSVSPHLTKDTDLVTIIERLGKRETFTPDFDTMRRYSHIPVFIYHRELLQHGYMNRILMPGKSFFLGRGLTVIDRYLLKETDTNTNQRTIAVMSNVVGNHANKMAKNRIKGEIYALTPEALLNVDRYLQNAVQFKRQTKAIWAWDQKPPFRHDTRLSLDCQMYMGNDAYWNNFKLRLRYVMKDHAMNEWAWLN